MDYVSLNISYFTNHTFSTKLNYISYNISHFGFHRLSTVIRYFSHYDGLHLLTLWAKMFPLLSCSRQLLHHCRDKSKAVSYLFVLEIWTSTSGAFKLPLVTHCFCLHVHECWWSQVLWADHSHSIYILHTTPLSVICFFCLSSQFIPKIALVRHRRQLFLKCWV